MESRSSLTILDDRYDKLRIVLSRIGIRFGQFYGWLKDKGRQIRSLPGNEDLIRAVFSEEKSPVEGARYRIGEHINVYHLDGDCRRFKICGIQSGGFSNVYTVIDLDAMRPYCLKENRALPGDEIEKNEKLAVEACISLRLGFHPNLLTTYSAFYFRSRLFILTEYLSATSLDIQLKTTGRLPLDVALKYAVHLCRGMHYAQETLPGFIHGDIKPGNCLITSEGTIKLCDFGLASAAGCGNAIQKENRAVRKDVTETDTDIGWGGTSAYMAPEMFDKNNPDRGRADIYAFGVTFFEMLCGIRPFVGASKDKLVEMHRDKEPPLKLLAEMSVPQPIIELVGRCLAKSPAQRPESFESVENELEKTLQDQFEIPIPIESAAELTESEIARRALSFAILGNFEEAAVSVDSVMKRRGRSPELLACKAIVLTLGSQPNDAYDASTAALMMRADLFIVLLAHAQVLISKGDLETAENYLHRGLQLGPDNCVTLNLLGDLYKRLQQYHEASIYFERSLTIDSSQTEAREELANIDLLVGQSDKAIGHAEKVLSFDPRRAGSFRILGDAYLSQNRLVEAIQSYKTALKLAPFSRETARRFVRSCSELYRTTGHSTDLHLLRVLVTGAKILQNANVRRVSANDFTKKFISVFRKSDFDPLLLFFLDETLARLADYLDSGVSEKLHECLQIVRGQSASHPLPVHVLDALGRIFYHLGEYKDCQSVFRNILKRFGPNGNSFYYLAACCEIQGDFRTSLEYYKRASHLEDCEDTRTGIQRVTARMKLIEKLSMRCADEREGPLGFEQ